MADLVEKSVVPLPVAQRRVAVVAGMGTSASAEASQEVGTFAPVPSVDAAPVVTGDKTPASTSDAAPVPRWHFVKRFCVGDVFKRPDGSTFSFRLIQSNTGRGFHPNSYEITSDKDLADFLRGLAKNPASGVVEIVAK